MKRTFQPERAMLIPDELRNRNQWVCWQYQQRDGKPTKIPINPATGRNAMSTNPATWTSFQHAVEVYEADDAMAGIGFVFAKDDDLAGVDLDHCFENGQLLPWAREIVDELDTFTEISPSGDGLHLICRGQFNGGGRKRDNVEIYQQGRYFTITGNLFEPQAREHALNGSKGLEALHQRLFGEREQMPPLVADGALTLSEDAMPPFEKLMALQEASSKFKQTYERQRKDLADTSGSGYCMSLALQALDAEWNDQEICNLLIYWRSRQGEDLKLERCRKERASGQVDWYSRTIQRARAKINVERADFEQQQAVEGLDCVAADDKDDVIQLLRRITGIPIIRFFQEGTEAAVYSVEIDGGSRYLVGDAQRTRSQDAWKDLAMELNGVPFPNLKADKWQRFMQALAQIREVEENEDTSAAGKVRAYLAEYLRGAADDDQWKSAAIANRPFTLDGETYLHAQAFAAWILSLHKDRALGNPNKLMAVLRNMGWERRTKMVRNGEDVLSRSFWKCNSALYRGEK